MPSANDTDPIARTGRGRLGLSIRVRLALLIGGLLAAVTLGYAVAAYWQMRSSATAALSARLTSIGGEWAKYLGLGVPTQLPLFRGVADSNAVRQLALQPTPDAQAAAAAVLSAALPLGGQRLLISVFSADFRELAHVGNPRPWADSAALRASRAAARDRNATLIGELRSAGDSVVYPITTPIIANGRIQGYVVEWLRLTIQPSPDQLNRLVGGTSIHVRLANQSGSVWSDLQHPIVRPATAPGATARLLAFDAAGGQRVIAAATPVSLTPWSVVVESSNEEQLTLARHFLAGLGGISLIALILGLIGAFVLSISLTDPLSKLTESAEAVADGDYARRTGLAHRRDELGRLAQAFDVMVDRLQSAFTAHRASEARHRHLFEALPLPCWVFDCDTLRILAVNDAAVRHYGYSRDEFLSMTIADLRPQEDVPRLRDLVAVNRDERRVSVTEWRHITKNGSVLNVETSSHSIVVDGHAARIAVIRDVTELRRAAAAMQRLKERYLRLIREAPNGVTLASLDGKFIAVNPAFVQMLGYASEAEVLAINASTIYANPEQRAALIAKMNGGQPVKREEILLKRKDGSTITTQFTGRIVHDDETDDEYMEAVSEDVTEQRRVEHQFHQAQKMEAVGQLAGGIAHDFNNLLTVILNYAELLATNDDLSADQREEAASIRQAARSAAALTRQLLILSRQQVVQPRPLHLNDLIDGVGKMLRRLIGENIELEMSLHPDTGLVKADPGQIEQVLVNLAVNARDAMPNGGKLLIESKNVTLRDSVFEHEMVWPAGDYVMLAVSDTGIGMDRATQARVFEPFFTTKDIGKGTGLGLATVYGIAKQSGGFVSLYSEPGKGAAFKVYLPRVDDVADSSDSGAPEAIRGGAETVLLVEDQPDVRQIVQLLLTRLGYRLLVASDAAAALTMIASHAGKLDLLITDVVLPGVSGRELANEITERFPAVKVLFISGYTDDAIVRHGVLEAGVHYLEKPFTPDALASKVRHVLEVELAGKRRAPVATGGR